MLKLRGLATGIGSLPHKDAEKALDAIFKYTPQAPFWPQLPKRSLSEGMVAQFSENVPCVKVAGDGVFFDGHDKDRELEIFYEHLIANDLDYFEISESHALGFRRFCQRLEGIDLKAIEFIKCHITGPFTFAAAIVDEQGASLLHDGIFRQVILKALTMKALWQIEILRRFRKKIILFIDEPYLGCFGSAYTPINREEVVQGLSELTASLKSEDTLLGVHCCGNTDWSIFTDIDTLDIINFDAFGFLDRLALYVPNLLNFFKRKGILAWGIVPTSEFNDKETSQLLTDRFYKGVELLSKKGIDREALLNNLLLSPSCGMGTLDVGRAENILGTLSEISERIRK